MNEARRAVPGTLLSQVRALAARIDEHGPLLAVIRAHAAGRAVTPWALLCTCGAGVEPGHHSEHLANMLAVHAEQVIAELSAIAWPDEPSPLEQRAFAAGRRAMLDDAVAALPAEHLPTLTTAYRQEHHQ